MPASSATSAGCHRLLYPPAHPADHHRAGRHRRTAPALSCRRAELLTGDEADRRGAGHAEGDGLDGVLQRPAGLGRDPDLGARVAHAEHVDQFLGAHGKSLLGV
ncbi:hypothetical protein [Frankia sp. CiP3]|uniref:hypothetical protein n=1 Tax=Frankia sp. CiP3 TaxID=2880971 RepID=UPI001EF64C11|nr:hypothetical protein [Frankia sp. CiP3]